MQCMQCTRSRPAPAGLAPLLVPGPLYGKASIIVRVRATGQTGVVKCVVRPGAHMPKTGPGDSVHTNFDRRKLMTSNNRRSVVVLPIFTPNTLLERACYELNENVLVLKMKQGTVKWQGFKVGQNVGLAAPVRERNVNVGGRWTSVVPWFHVWYSKLKYPSKKVLPTVSST